MKATLNDRVIADSTDIVEVDGYHYFPRATVKTEWLKKASKTASDNECPHGVQFYDVVIGDARHPRAAWSYEAPQPKMQKVDHRMGFWQDVTVT